jgi:malic enzyme
MVPQGREGRLTGADGEEILGIGDQGCGGILISIAKLVLMTICAGIHPNRVLPVVLDCGTDNDTLLNDPLYLGLKEKRVRGEKYDRLVTTFVQSARELFPKAYIHFEDFGLQNGESRNGSEDRDIRLREQHDGCSTSGARKSHASTTTSKEQGA